MVQKWNVKPPLSVIIFPSEEKWNRGGHARVCYDGGHGAYSGYFPTGTGAEATRDPRVTAAPWATVGFTCKKNENSNADKEEFTPKTIKASTKICL
jgi:hypothetical protein